jgi:endonuclease
MVKWAKENLKPGQLYTQSQIVDWFRATYPQDALSAIKRRVAIMSVNITNRDPRAKPGSGSDLFFKESSGQIRLWEPDSDPPPIYRTGIEARAIPTSDDDQDYEATPADNVEGGDTFALEKDLQNFLVRNLQRLEPGLKLYVADGISGIEYPAGNNRRIDILAVDSNGAFVVIELKVSRGYEKVIGQLQRYMAWIERELADQQTVRGIIVANEITEDLILATSLIADRVKLFEYSISFQIQQKER